MPRLSAFLLPTGLTALCLASAAPAAAFCRTTTVDNPSPCSGVCFTEGKPLFWAVASTEYVFNVRPFTGFTDAQARRIMSEAFGAWTSVSCPTTDENGTLERVSVGLEAIQSPGTTTAEVGPMLEEPNDNAVIFYSANEWEENDHDPKAFALTSLWFYPSGEIIGADMHFNGSMNFTECPAAGCAEDAAVTDLLNVATHEAGHYFGLAHSDSAHQDATMWCDASLGQIDKRTLSPDDIEGLCTIYPPGKAFMSTQTGDRGDDGDCSVAAPGVKVRSQGSRNVGGLLGLALLAFGFGVRRRVARAGTRLLRHTSKG